MHLPSSKRRVFAIASLCALSLVACSKKKSSTVSADATEKSRQPAAAMGTLSASVVPPREMAATANTRTEAPASDPTDRHLPKIEPCTDCSYQGQVKTAKEWARENGMKRIQHLVVEKDRSVEVYRSTNEERLVMQVVAAGYELTTFEGSVGSDAHLNRQQLGVSAPVLFELTVTDCPGGTCMASCGTGSTDYLMMSSKAGIVYVPFGSMVRSEILDEDKDGLVEFSVAYPVASLGTCFYHWCCFANAAGPSLSHYVGWNGKEWRDDLPRFRKFYEKQREDNARQLESLRKSDRRSPKVRCDLATASTQLFWLRQLFSEGVAELKKQWLDDLEGWKPIDCFVENNSDAENSDAEPSLRDNLQTQEGFIKLVLEWKPQLRYTKQNAPLDSDAGTASGQPADSGS